RRHTRFSRDWSSDVCSSDLLEQYVDQWLADCSDAAVLEINDGNWRFVHNKLRDGVIFDMSLPDFQELNRRAALAIESVYQYSTRSEEPSCRERVEEPEGEGE